MSTLYALLDHTHAQPGWRLELVARHQVRYTAVPIVFADSRKLAEKWTYRFLAAALVYPAPDHTEPDERPRRSALMRAAGISDIHSDPCELRRVLAAINQRLPTRARSGAVR